MICHSDNKKFKLILFVSVDLVGSTSYKTKAKDWVGTFESFYSEFPIDFHKEVNKYLKYGNSNFNIDIEVWKYAGDEIIFKHTLTATTQISYCLEGLKEVLSNWKSKFKNLKKQLDLKATVWIAGFPLNNQETDLYVGKVSEITKNENSAIVDYIGPDIDIGFRLSKYATKDRIVISPACLYILVKSELHMKQGKFNIKFLGKEKLKGVFLDDEYPIFYIDLKDKEHSWMIHDEVINLTDIKNDLEKLSKIEDEFFYLPKICNDLDDILSLTEDDIKFLEAKNNTPDNVDRKEDGKNEIKKSKDDLEI